MADQNQAWLKLCDDLEFEAPQLHDILALWRSKCRNSRLPGRDDFSFVELQAHMGWILLIDVEGDGARFRYRLVGSYVADYAGRDVTGRYFDELYGPEFLPVATSSFRKVVRTRQPSRITASLFNPERGHLTFEAVDLPLSSDGETVDMVMVRSVFDIEKSLSR